MKKIVLSVVGGSLFLAGYLHVHRRAAYVSPQPIQTSFVYAKTPTALFPIKALPAFAFRSR